MLPKLLWFQGLAEAAQVFAAVWEGEGGDAGVVRTNLAWPKTPPEAWMAAVRHCEVPTGAALEKRQEVVWEVPRAELAQVIEVAAAGSSRGYKHGPSWFWGGCYWEVDLLLQQPGLELRCFVSTCSKACVPQPLVLSASFSTFCQLPDGSLGAQEGRGCWFRPGSGFSRALPTPAPLKSVQQLASHLRKERLVVKAKIEDVR